MPDINEHTFEIRYKPNPKVLDYRGSWAEAISDHMKLPDWRILENRIDIYDEKGGERAFVGFRNAGFVTHNTPTKNYFPEKTTKFFRYVLNLDGFGKSLLVERIGVRSRFCRKYEGTFEELKEKYTAKYLSLTEEAKKIIDAKLLDIGGPLNFADRHGNFNTMSGPMIHDQLSDFFGKAEGLPKVGLYFDIDYWLKPNKEMDGGEILRNIEEFAISAWNKFESISALILGE
jgi:hypothetical protein